MSWTERTGVKWQEVLDAEKQAITDSQNPTANKDIDYVLVLSGRYDYRGKLSHAGLSGDQKDDHNRINLGIKTARQVAALRTGKKETELTNADLMQHGPTIIYNGRPAHNNCLKDVLENDELQEEFYYPKNKFEILDLPADMQNTGGHFESLKRAKDHINLEGKTIALVSSAYHWPRISRMPIGEYLGNVTIIPFLHDRKFKAPMVENRDWPAEIEKFPEYINKGFITIEPSRTIPAEYHVQAHAVITR